MTIKAKGKRKMVFQSHHLSKDPEQTVRLRRTEHYYITMINRINPITKGFIKALKHYVLLREEEAIDGENIRRNS